MGRGTDSRLPQVTWQSLNSRQQDYITAIYRADQDVEAEERGSWSRGGRPRPADQWRWMPYASQLSSKMPLPVKRHLSSTEQISEGTGATLEALEKRGLITMRHLGAEELRGLGIIPEWMAFLEADPIPTIQITPAGRKLVRQVLGVRSTAHVTGTLKEWHWRALSLAYAARESKGVALESSYYGHIGWKTWLRLRDYTPAPLIQEYHEDRGHSPSTGSPLTDYYVQITPFGVAFYERAFLRYQELYPAIEAPVPLSTPDPSEPFVEVVQGKRTCRACGGEYLVAVTRTYQQSRTSAWSVQEQDQRNPGRVTSKYGEVEQCTCQDADILEVSAPFLALLDQLIAQGWQMCFPRHYWFDYLDYLVGGVVSGREKRWYDPTLVKEKVLPLLESTDIDDARNVVKVEMHYSVNERCGKGSIYSPGLRGGLSMRPVAITCAKEANT